MQKRPLFVLIVAIAFILVGVVGFSYHIKDFFGSNQKLYEVLLEQFLRIVAVICGILLLRGKNAGRWLAMAWIISHIVISALNSKSATIAHILFLIVVHILLFLPISSAYFKKKVA